MIGQAIYFVIGFVVLVKGADTLIHGAIALAKKLRVSDWVVGLTVVAFGGSLPEWVVNMYAVTHGTSELALSNILGSNMVNIGLVLGVAACVYPLHVKPQTLKRDIPISIGSTLAVFLLALLGSPTSLGRGGGLVLLAGFAFFLFTIAHNSQREEEEVHPEGGVLKTLLMILLGFLGLAFGAQWIVDAAVYFARAFGVNESFIGFSVVAVGTSLPELAASVAAARRKNADIALANVIGSNIFNLLFVLGTSAILHPLSVNMVDVQDWAIGLAALLVLVAYVILNKERLLNRKGGMLLIMLYATYLCYRTVTL